MAGITLELDPTSEDASNAALTIADNSTTYFLVGLEAAPPAPRVTYASSVDTEGDIAVESKYDNRRVVAQVRAVASTDALLQTAISNVQKKVHKLNKERGTLKITLPSGNAVVADVCEASVSVEFDRRFTTVKRAMLSLEFAAAPFLRGAAVTLSAHSETSNPCLVFTETGITGDVPALGKLVITEADADDQWWVIWGQECRFYSSATSAALFYEAEGRTAMGGSATAAGPTGASGSGSNVMRNTALATVFQAILSTQATGGGSHLSHIGDFRVFARVQVPTTNAGNVTVALEWSQGDFRTWTRNAEVTIDTALEGKWALLDLGQVHLDKVVQGTQRWEGRIIAKSDATAKGTSDDDIDIDCLMLVPIAEGSGEVSGSSGTPTSTSFAARDEFEQTAGALNAKTLPVGGTWATSGAATDLAVDATAHTLTRATTSDADSRYALAGTTTHTNTAVQVDVSFSTWSPSALPDPPLGGLLARYVDTSNFAYAYLSQSTSGSSANQIANVVFCKEIGGSATLLDSTTAPFVAGTFYTLHIQIDGSGRWWLWYAERDQPLGQPLLAGHDTVFATGGTLASGKYGIHDLNGQSTAMTRSYDNFVAYAVIPDAAMYGSQSLEIRHDRVIREDSGGSYWQPASSYQGDYLRIPPAGKEARTLRMIVKASRNPPATTWSAMPDPAIDDISATLTYTPRYLVLPE